MKCALFAVKQSLRFGFDQQLLGRSLFSVLFNLTWEPVLVNRLYLSRQELLLPSVVNHLAIGFSCFKLCSLTQVTGMREKSLKFLIISCSGSYDFFIDGKFGDAGARLWPGRNSAMSFCKFLLSSSVSRFKFSKLLTIY